MRIQRSITFAVCLFMLPLYSQAELSITAGIFSDYVANGVTQTEGDPALQLSLDWANSDNLYVGAWASNVDFGEGDDNSAEVDIYAGMVLSVSAQVSVDLGTVYYQYFGDKESDDLAFNEIYALTSYESKAGVSEVNIWYSWNYSGTDAAHNIVQLAHAFALAENHLLRVSVDRLASMDTNEYDWEGHPSYLNYQVAYITQYKNLDVEIAATKTTLDIKQGDTRLVAGISRTFSF